MNALNQVNNVMKSLLLWRSPLEVAISHEVLSRVPYIYVHRLRKRSIGAMPVQTVRFLCASPE